MNPSYLLFLGLCMLNPSLQKTGMAMQKWAISRMSGEAGKAHRTRWGAVWIVGLVFQLTTIPLTFWALTIGNASTLGSFGGFGLICLLIFSRFVIKEIIVKREVVGIAIIMAGTAVQGFFSRNVQSPEVHLATGRTLAFFAVTGALLVLAAWLLKRDVRRFGGPVFGIMSGTSAGIGIVMQKVVTSLATGQGSGAMSNTILTLALSPYTWLMILGGAGGLVLAQFGYKYGKAVQVVPGFASTIVTVPVIAGVVILGESVPALCWLGVAIVTAGILVTTTTPRSHSVS